MVFWDVTPSVAVVGQQFFFFFSGILNLHFWHNLIPLLPCFTVHLPISVLLLYFLEVIYFVFILFNLQLIFLNPNFNCCLLILVFPYKHHRYNIKTLKTHTHTRWLPVSLWVIKISQCFIACDYLFRTSRSESTMSMRPLLIAALPFSWCSVSFLEPCGHTLSACSNHHGVFCGRFHMKQPPFQQQHKPLVDSLCKWFPWHGWRRRHFVL